jgi:hypothetical protein
MSLDARHRSVYWSTGLMRILRPTCVVGLTFFALLTRAAEDTIKQFRQHWEAAVTVQNA